jgi:hypothetical protein
MAGHSCFLCHLEENLSNNSSVRHNQSRRSKLRFPLSEWTRLGPSEYRTLMKLVLRPWTRQNAKKSEWTPTETYMKL